MRDHPAAWLRVQVRAEAQRIAVLAATLVGPAPVLALLPRTLNPKLLQQLTEDIGARTLCLVLTPRQQAMTKTCTSRFAIWCATSHVAS